MTDVFRTPDEHFEGLPDFDYEPHYREVSGLRLAHVDVGEGPPVVMLHGEPAWSFIWRRVIPPVRDAGYRCIAPDHAGFGRSDKPTDPTWYRLDRHVSLAETLLDDLDLHDATLVVHDWGGPIGLTLAVDRPDRISRVVIMDTVLFSGGIQPSETWLEFRAFVERTEDLPIGALVQASTASELDAEVVAAYDAPFPSLRSKVGARAFPLNVPHTLDFQRGPGSQRVIDALAGDSRPMLILWAESDLVLTLLSGERLAASIGKSIDHVIPAAGHGLQEDQGPLIGELIADWLGRSA